MKINIIPKTIPIKEIEYKGEIILILLKSCFSFNWKGFFPSKATISINDISSIIIPF